MLIIYTAPIRSEPQTRGNFLTQAIARARPSHTTTLSCCTNAGFGGRAGCSSGLRDYKVRYIIYEILGGVVLEFVRVSRFFHVEAAPLEAWRGCLKITFAMIAPIPVVNRA